MRQDFLTIAEQQCGDKIRRSIDEMPDLVRPLCKPIRTNEDSFLSVAEAGEGTASPTQPLFAGSVAADQTESVNSGFTLGPATLFAGALVLILASIASFQFGVARSKPPQVIETALNVSEMNERESKVVLTSLLSGDTGLALREFVKSKFEMVDRDARIRDTQAQDYLAAKAADDDAAGRFEEAAETRAYVMRFMGDDISHVQKGKWINNAEDAAKQLAEQMKVVDKWYEQSQGTDINVGEAREFASGLSHLSWVIAMTGEKREHTLSAYKATTRAVELAEKFSFDNMYTFYDTYAAAAMAHRANVSDEDVGLKKDLLIQAIEKQNRAVEDAPEELKEVLRMRLSLYRSKRPFRAKDFAALVAMSHGS